MVEGANLVEATTQVRLMRRFEWASLLSAWQQLETRTSGLGLGWSRRLAVEEGRRHTEPMKDSERAACVPERRGRHGVLGI